MFHSLTLLIAWGLDTITVILACLAFDVRRIAADVVGHYERLVEVHETVEALESALKSLASVVCE